MNNMTPEIERTIIHYYPTRALVSPLENEGIAWEYDSDNSTLKSLVADLKDLDPELRPGTRGRYDISEELLLFGGMRLQLSYIGPFAALNYGVEADLDEDQREYVRRIEKALDAHGIMLLEESELSEMVPWIQQGARGSATVWNCLFVHPEA